MTRETALQSFLSPAFTAKYRWPEVEFTVTWRRYVCVCSSAEESGVLCLKAECAVNDIACLLNQTKSVQWQFISLPSVDTVVRPLVIVDVQTAGPPHQPSIADLYPTSFDIVHGNDAQLFDIVEDSSDETSRRPLHRTAGDSGTVGASSVNPITDVHWCHMRTSIKHPVPDRVKP